MPPPPLGPQVDGLVRRGGLEVAAAQVARWMRRLREASARGPDQAPPVVAACPGMGGDWSQGEWVSGGPPPSSPSIGGSWDGTSPPIHRKTLINLGRRLLG